MMNEMAKDPAADNAVYPYFTFLTPNKPGSWLVGMDTGGITGI